MNKRNSFSHAIDKNSIPTINILGVRIADINMEWLVNFTKEHIKELSGDYICVSNVHTTVTAYESPEYCEIQNNGILAIPDGSPLSSVGRKYGAKNISRTAGPSYMEEIFKISSKNGYRHWFFGSTEQTLKKLYENLLKKYPGIKLVGMYSPPFRPMTEKEDMEAIEQINNSNPDFVWVGLGAPKQEEWMAKHQGKVNGLMVGVGAGFDYFAGNIKRAPKWMQNCGLEWLYRLIQDPRRLFKRYIVTNSKFIWDIIVNENKFKGF